MSWANQTATRLRHRGPDGSACASWNGQKSSLTTTVASGAIAGLVHVRLSIIDLSALGDQPMETLDGRYCMVFNGEIYNYKEIRAKLVADFGVTFKSQSDSEVLLQAWAHWGVDSIDRLVGMFTIAMIDRVERRLHLVRDHVGIKPLFYVQTDLGLAFASEPAELLEWPGVKRGADPQGVVDYLRFGFTDHRDSTLFQDVRQVRAGSRIEVSLDDPQCIKTVRYWEAQPLETLTISKESASIQLRQLLLESVELHLRSDVPVACCLSGGVDSSSIAMMMRHVGGPSLEIHTFSHIAPGTPFDEQRWMDAVNAKCGAVSHKVESHAADLVRDLPELVRKQQQPFSTTSIYAQYRIFECLHANGLKVTLDGQGADELFGGYGFHIGARLGSLLKARRFGAASSLLKRSHGMAGLGKKTHIGNALDYLLSPKTQGALRQATGKSLSPEWLDQQWCSDQDVSPDPYRTAHSDELLREALCRSLTGPGLPHLLRYEDHNSMAFGVESRVPFLSQPVIDFALSLPENYLVSEFGETKTLLRSAMRGIVPDAVLDRRDKVAFQTPESDWLKSLAPWIASVLDSEAANHVLPLNIVRAREHWNKVQKGEAPYSPVVWRWVNLIEWSRQYKVGFNE